MRKLFKGSKARFGAAIAAGVVGTQAMAVPLLTEAPTFSTDDVVLVFIAMLGSIALIWGLKKTKSMSSN